MLKNKQELEKQETKLVAEKAVLKMVIESANKQLFNLQVEQMQISQYLNKTQKSIKKTKKNPVNNTINFDNASEINAKPVSLDTNNTLLEMVEGRFAVCEDEDEDDEKEDDD